MFSHSSNRFRKALFGAVSTVAVAAVLLTPGATSHSATNEFRPVILEYLAASSRAYKALYDAAGRPKREILSMSHGEVWAISTANWDRFVALAKKQGLKFKIANAAPPALLAPMSAGTTMTDRQSTMMHDAMSSKAAMAMSLMRARDPVTAEYALTRGMHDTAPVGATDEIIIPLNATRSVRARRTSINRTANGYAWHGLVTETGEPATILWWPSGKVTGTVTFRRMVYSVRDFGNSTQGIVELNPQAFPQEHAPMSADLKAKMKMVRDPLISEGDASQLMRNDGARHMPESLAPAQSDDLKDAAKIATPANISSSTPVDITPAPLQGSAKQVVIRVIVAYTAAAAKHYDNIETDLIQLAIEEANQSFRNSGVGNVQLELAYAYRTTYVESGTHFEHVFRFANDRDGHMDEIHELRNRFSADVGVLIVADSNGCGLAAEVYARPERAFAVVNHECAATMYSLGHEIGHLIGTRHDRDIDDNAKPFAFGHGFVAGKAWRTMMSYKDSCAGCIRLPIWSNPHVAVHGVPAGSETTNNARVIAEQAARVAGFR